MTTDQIPREITSFLDKQKILILGLADEGRSSCQFLRSIFPEKKIGLADQRKLKELDSGWQQLISQDKNLSLFLGENYLSSLEQFQLIIKTPGIPLNLEPLQKALKNGVQISSNLELLMEIVKAWRQKKKHLFDIKIGPDNSLPAPIIIGITGTKGKSTTSAVTHQVLKTAGLNSHLMGNIGLPPLDKFDKIKSNSILVIEMSSHQLDQLHTSPDIAVIQKITSEHLDYYQSPEEYAASKTAITQYQNQGHYVILNPEWEKSKKIADLSPGRQLYFSLNPQPTDFDPLVYIKSDKLVFSDRNQEELIGSIQDFPLLGKHNLYNLMPAVIIGKMFGIETQKIKAAIENFKPLPHRLELVAEKNGVKYYNDSMATMPDAAESALSTFMDKPVVLIAGGHERNQDFGPLAEKVLDTQVKSLILFPPTGERICQQVKTKAQERNQEFEIDCFFADSMDQAVKTARKQAQPGDIVLLSPGAASFGVFKSYKDRGKQFRRCVKEI